MLSKPSRALLRYQFQIAKTPNPKFREKGKQLSIWFWLLFYGFFGWSIAAPIVLPESGEAFEFTIGGGVFPPYWLLVLTFSCFISGISAGNFVVQIKDEQERKLFDSLPVRSRHLALSKLTATLLFVMLMSSAMMLASWIALIAQGWETNAIAIALVTPLCFLGAAALLVSFESFALSCCISLVPPKYWTLALAPLMVATFGALMLCMAAPEVLLERLDGETMLLIPPMSFAAPIYWLMGARSDAIIAGMVISAVSLPLGVVGFNLLAARMIGRVIDRAANVAGASSAGGITRTKGELVPARFANSSIGAGWLLARRTFRYEARARSALISSTLVVVMSFVMAYVTSRSGNAGMGVAIAPVFLMLGGFMVAESCRYSGNAESMEVLEALPGNPSGFLWLGVFRALSGMLLAPMAILAGVTGLLISGFDPIVGLLFGVSLPGLWCAGWFISNLSAKQPPFSRGQNAVGMGNIFQGMIKIYLLLILAAIPTFAVQFGFENQRLTAFALLAESVVFGSGVYFLWRSIRGPKVLRS